MPIKIAIKNFLPFLQCLSHHKNPRTKKVLWALAIIALVFSTPGCKHTHLDFDIVGTWEFTVSFDDSANLNLPRLWVFTFTEAGDVFLFSQLKGQYSFSDNSLHFDCPYPDRYRFTEYEFSFEGEVENDTHFWGRIYNTAAGKVEVGTFNAERIPGLQTFDIVGTWDFDVTYTVDYYRTILPQSWEFTFKANGELWLYDQRKQTYDFDGRNVRFPCHYYFDLSTHSAVHLLFLGYMTNADEITGYLYNDVGGSLVIGIISGRRSVTAP